MGTRNGRNSSASDAALHVIVLVSCKECLYLIRGFFSSFLLEGFLHLFLILFLSLSFPRPSIPTRPT